MITESFRKRRLSDTDEDPNAKRSKLMSDAPSLPATWQSTCMDSCADSISRATKSDAAAEQEAQPGITTEGTVTHVWRTKENRSPNLTMLQQLQEDLDPFVEGQQIADQVASLEEGPVLPTQTSEGLLNLLLLADSSLQDTSNDQLELADTTAKQEPADYDQSDSDSEQSEKDYEESSSKEEQGGSDSNESSFDREGSQAQTASSTACATQAPKRPTAAGLRPRITAQVASLMSVSIDLDSDSSNDEEEEEPLPVKKHKGMGRYGQDLHNTACLALKQTNLLKKKSANRTTKTVRQLCNAKEHSCEAAQKAVEATKAAEKAVQNLAQFAEAFDDLVKEAVRAANAAAQSRADYAVSVVAADMAEARRDRVMSKRGRRRSTSPKTPKRMSWAADEQLVQERVFSKADPPSATSFATSMAAAPATH
ncbi:TPA: hypothetical protein ACH3X2_001024 [Trebouxia sp. C0005]